MRNRSLVVAGIAFAMSAVAVVAAAPARNDTGAEPSDPHRAGVVGAGLNAYIDPNTGELTDTPVTADQRAFARQALPRRDYSRMQLQEEPDGTLVLHTNGQMRMSAVITQDADGTLHQQCLPTGQEPQP